MHEQQDVVAELPGRGVKLHYRDWGGNGPPIVLLHGLASSARIWDMVSELLVPRFRLIAVDQRGHGLSDKPEDGYGFDDVTADVAALVDMLGRGRPVLVGHSWGGSVALEFAARYPDASRGIVLVDGGFMSMDPETAWEKAEEMMRPPDIDGMEVGRFVQMARSWRDIADLWNDQLEEMMLSIFEVSDGKIYRRLPIPTHMKIARAIWEQRNADLWEKVAVPALLIPAMREPANEREAAWYEAKLRGIKEARQKGRDVRVMRMENTIHDIPVQRPNELAEAIADFTESVSGQGRARRRPAGRRRRPPPLPRS